MRARLINECNQPLTVCELHLFLAEVQLKLQQGSHLYEFTPEKGQFIREPAAKLVVGNAVRCRRSGRNQVRYRLGLGQVHLAVQEGPAGKLARSGQAAAGRQQPADKFVGNVSRSVERDLHGVFAGIAVRGTKHRNQYVIQPGHITVMDSITSTSRDVSTL